MNSRADNPELDALLGAYALDALDADERRQVEEYLAQNPAARSEVDELRETAASLALSPAAGADEAAPAELWQRISQSIADEPKSQAPADELAARRQRRRTPWVVAVASVAAALVLVLGAQVVSLNGRLDDSRTVAAAFDRAAKAKGAKNVALQADGTDVARVVVLPDGSGFLKADALPKLPDDQTYQLWALTGDPDRPTAISAGVLGSQPQAVGFHTNGPVDALALTVEHEGGAVQPSQSTPPFASAALS
jgi:anti-sigma-K factor RskA